MASIGRRAFLDLLAAEFPEMMGEVLANSLDLLHLQAAAIPRRHRESHRRGAVLGGRKHFRFVERVMGEADAEVENALAMSYLEDFALGEWTPERHRAVKERMSRTMRAEMVRINPNWR